MWRLGSVACAAAFGLWAVLGAVQVTAQAVTPEGKPAQSAVIPAPVLELSLALKVGEVMQVLREEGMASGADLASALLKLHEDNAATLTPDPVYVRFYYSHPPASERLAALALRTA